MQDFLKSLTNSSLGGGIAGGLSGGLLVGLLSGKKSRKLAGKAVKIGGAAVIGGLAWEAYRRYQHKQGQNGGAPEAVAPKWNTLDHSSFASSSTEVARRQENLIVRAMIAAAQSDGNLNQSERIRILERIERSDATLEQKAKLLSDMSVPQELTALVREDPCPELAVELYVASVLVLEGHGSQEHPHLAMLAAMLKLPPDLVDEIHEGLEPNLIFEERTGALQGGPRDYEVSGYVA